jgi:hypothetical protein
VQSTVGNGRNTVATANDNNRPAQKTPVRDSVKKALNRDIDYDDNGEPAGI